MARSQATEERKLLSPYRLSGLQQHRRWLLPALVLVMLCCLTLIGATWVAWSVFDHVPHLEDELAFVFQARTLAAGRLVAEAPAQPAFFDLPFILIRDGMWFGKYPPGYPAVLALGVLAGDPWLVNAVAGVLCVLLVYLVGRRLYSGGTGLLAAALLVASPLFLLHTGTVMSHVVSLAWALVLLLLFAITRRAWHPLAALGVGAAAGALFLTRPLTAIGVGLPFAIWVLADLLRRRPQARAIPLMALGFLPFLAAFLAYNWLTTGAPLQSAYELYWPHDRVGFGEGYDTDGSYTLEEARIRTGENLEQLSMYLFGWPLRLSLVPLGLAGLALVAEGWRRVAGAAGRRRGDVEEAPSVGRSGRSERDAGEVHPAVWDVFLVGIVVSLIGVYVAYWAANSLYGPRYYFEALGALTLLSARGLQHVMAIGLLLLKSRWPGWQSASFAAMSGVLMVAGSLSLAGWLQYVPEEFGTYRGWYGIDGADLRVVQAADLRQAVVFIVGSEWGDYAPLLSLNAPTLDGDVIYARDLGDALNRELMARYPGRAFYRYADGQLQPLPPLATGW